MMTIPTHPPRPLDPLKLPTGYTPGPSPADSAWIQTFTGKQFWPLNPRPDDIIIEDIAHALGMICRFNGHCREFYSVAQHCVLMARYMYRAGLPPEVVKWGLMHDAAEAYLADLARPVKRCLPDFDVIEDRLLRVVADRFSLCWPLPPEVAHWDLVMLRTEKRDLMGEEPQPWPIPEEPAAMPWEIITWNPRKAEDEFLYEYNKLFLGINAREES